MLDSAVRLKDGHAQCTGKNTRNKYSTWNRKKTTLFFRHYLRNRSTSDIGVLGYIGVLERKEHSTEVWHIPPGTSCTRPKPYFRSDEEGTERVRQEKERQDFKWQIKWLHVSVWLLGTIIHVGFGVLVSGNPLVPEEPPIAVVIVTFLNCDVHFATCYF